MASMWPKGGYIMNKIPPFPHSSLKQETEIDLREEMKIILEGNAYWPRRGHWCVLRRMDKRQRCNCWNEQGQGEEQYSYDNRKYDEPRLRCPVCNGSGWIYEDELHLMRRRIVTPDIGLANIENLSPIGFMNITYIVFYMQHYSNPKKEDKIFEIELDSMGDPIRPFVYNEEYNIAIAEPFRDKNGRIEYWRVSAKLEVV